MNETYLEEKTSDAISVSFTVNDMPLQQLKRFKNYAKDWRGNYSVTIQVLMDKAETLEYLRQTDAEIEYGEEEDAEETEVEEVEEVKTLGE